MNELGRLYFGDREPVFGRLTRRQSMGTGLRRGEPSRAKHLKNFE
jgi:hypothetical protein